MDISEFKNMFKAAKRTASNFDEFCTELELYLEAANKKAFTEKELNDMLLPELIDVYRDQECLYGDNTEKNLEKLVEGIGYPSLDEFFRDNPGVVDAVATWLGDSASEDWETTIRDLIVFDEGEETEE